MQRVSVELNFFYMHYNDAQALAELADRNHRGELNPSIYARHAVISTVFASEALINRVLSEFSTDPNIPEILDRNSILDKWYLAPLLCRADGAAESFDKGSEPFQSFKELIKIRNWLAHPKVENLFDATLDPNSTIRGDDPDEEYPWLEMLKGEKWSQLDIPKNPFELDYSHAQTAISVLDGMIEALSAMLGGLIHDGWLELITIKDENGLHNYRAPVFSVWGGYGGPSDARSAKRRN